MKFNLKQIEAFVWVADLGSFRKAADRLNTTQPNISARIARLESVLGINLMERDAGSVRLTAKGQDLLIQARRILEAVDEFTVSTEDNALVDGVLRLGVTELIVHTWLGRYLRALKDHYPGLSVELTVDLSANIDELLARRGIDLALQSEPFAHASSGLVELGVYPFIWVASPALNLHRRRRLSMAELAEFPILTHARNTHPFRQVSGHFVKRRDIRPRLVPSSNLAACIQMAVDDYGCAAIPEVMVQQELKQQKLVRLNYPWQPESLRFFARYDRDRGEAFVVRAAEIARESAAKFSPLSSKE